MVSHHNTTIIPSNTLQRVSLLFIGCIFLVIGSGSGKSIQGHEYPFGLNNQVGSVGGGEQHQDSISPPQSQIFNPDTRSTPILNLEFSPPDTLYEESPILSPVFGASAEADLFNYLKMKNRINRMKEEIQTSTLQQQQRKRNSGQYWKMCAFNAVSCFG